MRKFVPIFVFIQIGLCNIVSAQEMHSPGGQAIDIGIHQSDVGYSLSAGYMQDISYNTFYRIKAFGELGKVYSLNYNNFGGEASLYHTPFFISYYLQLNLGVGFVVGKEQIKGLPEDKKDKIGIYTGAKVGMELEGFLNETMSCFLQADQMYMLKQSLGKQRFQGGVGLRFYLNNFYWR